MLESHDLVLAVGVSLNTITTPSPTPLNYALCFSEHQEFSREISETTDPRIREDLERELDALVSRMEAKSMQISKIRKHQEKVMNNETWCILIHMSYLTCSCRMVCVNTNRN